MSNSERRADAAKRAAERPSLLGKQLVANISYVDATSGNQALRAAAVMHYAKPDEAREALRWHTAYRDELRRLASEPVGHDDTAEYDTAAAINNEAVGAIAVNYLCVVLAMCAWPGDVVARGNFRCLLKAGPKKIGMSVEQRVAELLLAEEEFVAALRAEFGSEAS